MASEPTVLDYSKFNLDAFETTADVNMKMLKAYADFNYRMMEVAQLKIRVETDQTKLAILRKSFQTFVAAEQEAKRRIQAATKDAKRLARAIRDLNHLLLGEAVSVPLIPLGWQGFRYLMLQADTATMIKLSQARCESGDREGSCFFDPARPDDEPASAPTRITQALALMDWARRANLVPRLGSGAQNRLCDLLAILGSAASSELKERQKALKDAEQELARVRETSWDNLDVLEEKPKSK